MPVFCQAGQKAYLRINGGTPIEFDGPIDVQVNQEQGETFYPGWWYYDIEFTRWICQTPSIGYSTTGTHRVRAYVLNKTSSAWNPVYLRAVPRSGYVQHDWVWPSDESGAATYSELPGKWTARVSSNLCGDNPKKPEFKKINQDWTRVGHTDDPIPGVTTYQILVNGSVIKESDSPIEYTVRCGDRCPEGERWDEECGKCVCENLEALLGAARGINNLLRQF